MSYQWMMEGESVIVQWTDPGLRSVALFTGALLLPAAAFLWKRWKNRWAAAAASAGTVFFWSLAFTSAPAHRWAIDGEGIVIGTPRETVSIPWKDLASVRVDREAPELSGASLVLEDAGGRRAWLTAGWLVPEHRRLLVEALARRAPAAMSAVTGDADYLKSLEKEPSSGRGKPDRG